MSEVANYDSMRSLQELRYLILENKVLKFLADDRKYLLRFLYSTNFNVSKAFEKVQNYHKLLAENRKWFLTSSPLDLKERFEENSKTILLGCDKNDRRIIVVKFEVVIHIVNTSFFINLAIKAVWPFFSEKVKDMFKFHFDNLPSLHEYIDPVVLPPEYGGTGPNIDYEGFHKYLYGISGELENRLGRRYRIQDESN